MIDRRVIGLRWSAARRSELKWSRGDVDILDR
jgi:hypothetical protein